MLCSLAACVGAGLVCRVVGWRAAAAGGSAGDNVLGAGGGAAATASEDLDVLEKLRAQMGMR